MNKFTIIDWIAIILTSWSITQCAAAGDIIMSIIIFWVWDFYCLHRTNFKY